MFKVFETESYAKQISKWVQNEKQFIQKIVVKLKNSPFSGKRLYLELMEKKLKNRRIYYLVYEDLLIVLFVSTSKKKNQQKTIDHIKKNLSLFRKYAEDLSDPSNSFMF